MTGAGGDAAYISDARRIQDNVQQILLISAELSSGGVAGGGWLHGRLKEARSLAMDTHGMLKRFSVIASESTASGTERSQRRQTHRKLNSRYQSALKAIDRAAQEALGQQTSTSNEPLAENLEPIPALYSSSLGADSDLGSVGSSRPRRFTNQQFYPIEEPYQSDYYPVSPTQVDSTHVPFQQVLTYPSYRQPGQHYPQQHYPQQSAVELRGTATTTASGTLRSLSMGSQRDLEFMPVRMVHPEDLHARLLSEKARGALQIETDVKGIRQLYQEMAWQVNNDGEDLDAIETQMRLAVDLSTHSVSDLRATSQMLRPQTKLLWFLIATGGVIGFLLVIWFMSHFL